VLKILSIYLNFYKIIYYKKLKEQKK